MILRQFVQTSGDVKICGVNNMFGLAQSQETLRSGREVCLEVISWRAYITPLQGFFLVFFLIHPASRDVYKFRPFRAFFSLFSIPLDGMLS